MKKININLLAFFASLILMSSSCVDSEKNEVLLIFNKDSSYQKGSIFNDSLYHGVVNLYDKKNKNIGYTNFKYGLKNGPSVLYFDSGIISDSVNYINGLKNGYEFKYDSSGKLLFNCYYHQGLKLGHVIKYDVNGKISEYHFNGFEKRLLYSITQLSDSVFEERGEEINAIVYRTYEQNIEKVMLFLYILNPPYYKNHYEIAIFDTNKKMISSKKIISDHCFYEQELALLPRGNTYGIVMHKFNSYKLKDDLVIKLIQ